jgi:Cu+-exporting ATPase
MTDSLHTQEKKQLICYHCGDDCTDDTIAVEEKIFCCTGCRIVFEILAEKNLCNYYSIEQNPGISPVSNEAKERYRFLDEEEIKLKTLDFSDGKTGRITFYIPQIHCSSCIWLLENLHKLDKGIKSSEVNFLQKQLTISFGETETTLRKIVELLHSIGYEPDLNSQFFKGKAKSGINKKLYYKVGIAGFAFGNIMLFSFPEYLGLSKNDFPQFYILFAILNVFLSIPVFFYSATEYFKSAYKGLKKKIINIDFPLSIGIVTLYAQSLYEVISGTGMGYFDSFTGLVFFLLAGKIFQNKTYEFLNFERDYRSYFPLSVHVLERGVEKSIPASHLKNGQRIIIRNNEIIPADSILFKGDANIDYSFVTGESIPVNKVLGEIIYAGGRQTGNAIELEVLKKTSQSYLTQLWNSSIFNKEKSGSIESITNNLSRYFTYAIIFIALIAGLLWYFINPVKTVMIFVSILIVACPCAFALAIPFTSGNTIRIFGRNKFYLKNISVIESLSKSDTVVFDKTGTITQANKMQAVYTGEKLNYFELSLVKSVIRNSNHILSRKIYDFILSTDFYPVENYIEHPGSGQEGVVQGNKIVLGSEKFIKHEFKMSDAFTASSRVFLAINGRPKGYFEIKNTFREGLEELVTKLKRKFTLFLISGDNDSERKYLSEFFTEENEMFFRQTPEDKLNFVKNLQNEKRNVLMVGDGLNDAGALQQSNTGITVSDTITNFSPACDAILDSKSFGSLSEFISFSEFNMFVIKLSYVVSFLYNIIGLWFAVQGYLSPIVAAILMPVSSISVVFLVIGLTNRKAKKSGFL